MDYIKEINDLRIDLHFWRDRAEFWRNEALSWKAKAQDNWDILETVAMGEKMKCAACDKYKPCLCDK